MKTIKLLISLVIMFIIVIIINVIITNNTNEVNNSLLIKVPDDKLEDDRSIILYDDYIPIDVEKIIKERFNYLQNTIENNIENDINYYQTLHFLTLDGREHIRKYDITSISEFNASQFENKSDDRIGYVDITEYYQNGVKVNRTGTGHYTYDSAQEVFAFCRAEALIGMIPFENIDIHKVGNFQGQTFISIHEYSNLTRYLYISLDTNMLGYYVAYNTEEDDSDYIFFERYLGIDESDIKDINTDSFEFIID